MLVSVCIWLKANSHLFFRIPSGCHQPKMGLQTAATHLPRPPPSPPSREDYRNDRRARAEQRAKVAVAERICGGIFGGLENCRKSGGRRGRYVGDGGKDKPVGSKLSRSLENIALPQKQDEEANKFKNAPPRRMLKQVQYIRM